MTLRLEIEHPQPDAIVHPGDQMLGFGWVLADAPILGIDVALDDVPLGQAITGLMRTDIAEDYPDHPGSAAAGFTFVAAIPPRAAALPELRLTLRTEAGTSRHTVPLQFAGPERLDAPSGAPLDLPELPPAELEPIKLALEEARLDLNGQLLVRGWALTAIATQSVEILLGDHSLGFADAMLSREDVGAAFPHYPDASHSGFLLKTALPPDQAGAREVRALVTDVTGETASASLPIGGPGMAKQADAPAVPPLQAVLEEARVTEHGVLRVRGWAAGLSLVEQVRVYLDETLIGLAAHRQPRGDVALAYPDYPDAANSGFLLQQDMPDGPQDDRIIRVNVAAQGGIRRNLTAPLTFAPVIKRRERAANAVEFHCDSIALTEDGTLTMKGWAVCASGTEAIEVDVGEDALGRAVLGEERADVGNHFPQIASARTAGFRFSGRMPGRCEGEYIARVSVDGRGGEHRTIHLPVLAVPGEPGPAGLGEAAAPQAADRGIRYYLDTPAVRDGRAVDVVSGFLSLNGWAFSGAGISGIDVFVDGRLLGQAHRGIRREDLFAAFGRKEALRSGFAMLVPPQVLKKGTHEVRIVIADAAGQREEIGFTLESDPSLEGPGPWMLRGKLTQAEVDLQSAILAAAGYAPEYTLLLPPGAAAPTQAKKLRATLASLRRHAYPRWRLLLPAAKAERAAAAALLRDYPDLAPHVDLAALPPQTKLADLATGETGLLVLLSPGDELGEDALLELSVAGAVQQPPPDLLYADERRTDPADGVTRAFFKPDWSPDLLLSTNYIGRLWAARREALARAGLTLADLAQHGEYDAVLRLSEAAERIAHVPKVLAERAARALDTPALERRALARALARRDIAAEVLPGCIPGSYRVQRAVRRPGLVSIVMPSIAARGLVATAIESIRRHTARERYEIVLLDNLRAPLSPDAQGWKAWFRANADRVIEIDEKFNWSRFNNLGARAAGGEYLLFLNDDIEILDDSWLDGLLEHAQRDEVGAVGPQLLYPGGAVQHAGMFLSGGVGRHAFRFSPRDEPGPFGLARTQRNVIAVTGACLMTRRAVFEDLGGFDEEHSVINNDLDFCLRVRRAGRSVIYTPHVTLTHHEMVSRSELRDAFNAERFASAWRDVFSAGDPYFNPNLAPDVDDYVPEQEPFKLVHVGHPVIARERVRRILAVKLDHIGDFIACLPAFRRLKAKFPNAELTVLAGGAAQQLAALEPAIDRMLRFDFFHARSERGRRAVTKKELQALREQLAPYDFDLAIDLRRQPDTRQVLPYTGARWLAGFDTDNRTEYLDIAAPWEGDTARTHKRTHISDALVQFVDAVAVACEPDQTVIAHAAAQDEARRALLQLPALQPAGRALLARRLVCLHVGAGAENKRWPVASFAALADLLVGYADVNVAVIGGPDEAGLVAELASLVRHKDRLHSMVGKLTLPQLPLLLRCADLYVGNDSGPKHMAAALGVPTIGIHSGSVDAVEWGPMGPAAFGVRRATTCSPCYLAKASDCPRALACIHGIRVRDVFVAAQRLMTLTRH